MYKKVNTWWVFILTKFHKLNAPCVTCTIIKNQTSPVPSALPWGLFYSLSTPLPSTQGYHSPDFACFCSLHEWNHTSSTLLCLTTFAQQCKLYVLLMFQYPKRKNSSWIQQYTLLVRYSVLCKWVNELTPKLYFLKCQDCVDSRQADELK